MHLKSFEPIAAEDSGWETRQKNSVSKLFLALEVGRSLFGRDPTRRELSILSGLSEKTAERIITNSEFKEFVRLTEKKNLNRIMWHKVSLSPTLTMVLPRGRLSKSYSKREGRPNVTFVDVDKHPLPGIVAHLGLFFAELREEIKADRELISALEERNAFLKKRDMRITRSEISTQKLPQIEAAITYSLISGYAKNSTQQWYFSMHNTINEMLERAEKSFSHYDLAPSRYRTEYKTRLAGLREISSRMSKIVGFSTTMAFRSWMENYRVKERRQKYLRLLRNGNVHSVVKRIFDQIYDEVLESILSQHLKHREV
ncbi:hypothetical protein HY640_03720 [Candidatus Woesearchaeota archaeon]|nr:hypothetical protein [Candidatus Woesearchaeota archaeon]